MRLRRTIVALALGLTAAMPALAQYPDRPINFIIGAAAGGTSDIRVRSYLPFLEECLGQPIVPINRTPQTVGWSEASKAAPDGYTLTALGHPNFALAVLRGSDVDFTIESFDWLGNMFENYTTLAVRKDSPFQDIDQLVDALKANQSLNFGISRLTSDDVLLLLNLKRVLGLDITPIPLGGSAEAMTALLGGHVDAIVASAESTITNKEQIRALAIATAERISTLPDVPTFSEKNIPITGYLLSPIAAPAGLPAEAKDKLVGCIAQMVEDPDFLAEAARRGATVNYMAPDELLALIKQNHDEIAVLLEENKALLDGQ